ncbi:hypothetical protein ELQ90_03420 [Labedella phragmitis]|uniref:DUF2238 domain-containing protein n=1 Tax=Labedella phragmitis TaxID=2498849 RepID=A0A444PYN5_9MICO|nr:hypothetical protein [Labedella phragmitis]RWZ52994.1 hypothetical protein ELQ90_03420 [Labedella phragmitis]
MIENFLRRPHGRTALAADVVRVLGLLSVVAAAVWWSATDAGVLALVLPALLLPRFIAARPLVDLVYGIVLLVAAWSNVFDLYTSISWWDLAVHLACTGVVAAMLFLLLTRVEIITAPASGPAAAAVPIVLTALIGLAASAVWEMIEWLGKAFVSDDIFVAYDDTIADMAIGGLGALLAGVALASMRRQPWSDSVPAPEETRGAAVG